MWVLDPLSRHMTSHLRRLPHRTLNRYALPGMLVRLQWDKSSIVIVRRGQSRIACLIEMGKPFGYDRIVLSRGVGWMHSVISAKGKATTTRDRARSSLMHCYVIAETNQLSLQADYKLEPEFFFESVKQCRIILRAGAKIMCPQMIRRASSASER